MKIKELRKLLNETAPDDQELELKVWLPGSRITLSGSLMRMDQATRGTIMIEGNVDEGSALGESPVGSMHRVAGRGGMSRTEVAELAAKTSDAYMYDAYGETTWQKCIYWLSLRGFNAPQIEAIVRSKYMRWASDAGGGPNFSNFIAWWQDAGGRGAINEMVRHRG